MDITINDIDIILDELLTFKIDHLNMINPIDIICDISYDDRKTLRNYIGKIHLLCLRRQSKNLYLKDNRVSTLFNASAGIKIDGKYRIFHMKDAFDKLSLWDFCTDNILHRDKVLLTNLSAELDKIIEKYVNFN